MKSHVCIIAAAALWGCIGIFLKLLTAAGLGTMQAVAVRVILAAVLYAAFLLITDRKALHIRPRDIWMFIGTGICSLVFFNFCYFSAIKAIGNGGLGVAAVLLYTAPVFVMIMSAIFFREKLTPVKIAALVLTFAGCLLVTGVVGSKAAIPTRAILFGLGSGFGYALYSIFGKAATKRYSSKTITVWSFICGAVAVVPFMFGADWSGLMTARGIFGALGISILCCILPYLLYTEGLKSVEPGRASVMATVEPVVAAIIGIFYGEMPTLLRIAGMALVIGAIALMSLAGKKKSA
jgi:drug/metabolite transporter (DMT)-like permease